MKTMKILVCISHVPDTTTKIVFSDDGAALNKNGVTFVINPYDEYGLSKALDIKEAGTPADIVALCVGGPEVDATLRKALAIGADSAVRIDVNPVDSFQVATEIANYAKGKDFDLIFTGKESIDFNSGLVPGMVAEMLALPFVSFAVHMELNGQRATLRREVDGGAEVVETALPAVVSCQKGISEWRIPNMRGIMAARTKPLVVAPGSNVSPEVKSGKFSYPPAKGSTVYIDPASPEKLIESLAAKGVI